MRGSVQPSDSTEAAPCATTFKILEASWQVHQDLLHLNLFGEASMRLFWGKKAHARMFGLTGFAMGCQGQTKTIHPMIKQTPLLSLLISGKMFSAFWSLCFAPQALRLGPKPCQASEALGGQSLTPSKDSPYLSAIDIVNFNGEKSTIQDPPRSSKPSPCSPAFTNIVAVQPHLRRSALDGSLLHLGLVVSRGCPFSVKLRCFSASS